MTSITCYDGVGCIGGNKILLEDGGTNLWLDFGLDFGRMGRYYEEYLKPKGCLGLYEPVQMGLLPPILDIYRTDLVCDLADPWCSIDGRKLGDVAGVLLSHAHMDHIGALPYLREDIPIYSSAVTLAMSKATQDSGISGIGSHYCYLTSYEPTETGELKSTSHTKEPSKARPYVFVGEGAGDALQEFWDSTPGSLSSRGRKHDGLPITTASTCGGLNIRRLPVDHSVYGACAWAIETSAGWVVYAGDLRCHGGNAEFTWEFAREAAKLNPRALIIEGTRIQSEDTLTECQVKDCALDEIRKATGLVVADFGPRNVERLVSFLEIAKETGRKLVLLPKDVYLLDAMALAGADVPSLDDPSILIYSKYETASVNWKRMLKEQYEPRMVRHQQIAQNQDRVICCFSFFDVNELAYIRPVPGSMWLFSSCEAFNEEMSIDFQRLGEWIERYGMAFPGDPRNKGEKSPFHVSGHACRKHLMQVIDIINPQVVIPVHTERPDLYAQALDGRHQYVLPERGVEIVL